MGRETKSKGLHTQKLIERDLGRSFSDGPEAANPGGGPGFW